MTTRSTMPGTARIGRAAPSSPWAVTFTRTLIYVILVAIVVVEAFPLVWMIVTSLKDPHEVFNSVLPGEIRWQNFPRVWYAMNFPVHLGNSLYVTGLTVSLVVVLATPAAYAFARYRFPGREIVFYAFLGAMMIPPQAILIPMFQFLKSLHLLDSLNGLAFSFVGGGTAFAVFLMRTFFLSLPRELGDSARTDGCNDFQVFWYIYLPLARPGIATVVIIQSLYTWNEFMFSNTFIITPGKKTVQSAVFQAIGQYSTDYTALCSGLMIALVPVVAIYLILQRQFIGGLTAGALKG
ncbi:MAG TPA: carbohydrate ABC transporter permease [Kaistia sp.]|nr:carbohydrate ABC transporter permease [Kaistia sp.]